MKYEIDGEKTIEKYLINIGIITIYYLDGSIENVEYTKENEMAILDEMIRQAKKLISQKEYFKFERKKYFNLASSTLSIFRTKKRKYLDQENALERKLIYIYNLETYFEIKEKYDELIASGDAYLQKYPPLTINTYDELCRKRDIYGNDIYFEIFSYVKEVMLDEEWEENHKRYYAVDEETEMLVNTREVPSISTYNTLDDYHYEHKPKVLSKVLVNPFKDLDI